VCRRVFRYRITSSGNAAITFNDFFEMQFIASSATSGVRLFASMKLVHVDVWSIVTATGVDNAINFEWGDFSSTADGAPYCPVNSTSVDTMHAPHFRFKPMVNSSVSKWMVASVNDSSTIFTVSGPVGAVVDITVDCIITGNTNSLTMQTVQRAVAGASAGQIYGTNLPSGAPTLSMMAGITTI